MSESITIEHEQKAELPELLEQKYRDMLFDAYKVIEAEIQRRKAKKLETNC